MPACWRLLLVCSWIGGLGLGCERIDIPLEPPPPPYTLLAPDDPAVASQLTVAVLGNANVLISDGSHALLMDGYFTRPGPLCALFGATPSLAAMERGLERGGVTGFGARLDAVIVAHSHIDHALDSPGVAELTGATLLGSPSTGSVAEGYDLHPDLSFDLGRFVAVPAAGGSWSNATFEVRLEPSDHGVGPSAIDSLLGGVISDPLVPPAAFFRYKEGAVYAVWVRHIPTGKRFVIQSSAGTVPFDDALQADVVFLGLGYLGSMDETGATRSREAYYREFVTETGASLVIPTHWDDFFRSLDRELRPRPDWIDHLDVAKRYLEERVAADPGVEIYWLPPFQRLVVP